MLPLGFMVAMVIKLEEDQDLLVMVLHLLLVILLVYVLIEVILEYGSVKIMFGKTQAIQIIKRIQMQHSQMSHLQGH